MADLLKQLADLLNLSFMTGVFPSVLKKKDSKLDYSNYCLISLLSINAKILEKLITGDSIPFSITIILSITYNLDPENNILHFMH